MASGPRLFSLPQTRKWRVKLYLLNNDSWKEISAGMLFGTECKDGGNALVLEDLEDSSKQLFYSLIRPGLAFQKQETLLLWQGPVDDLILSNELDLDTDDSGNVRVAFGFEIPPACTSMAGFVIHAIYEGGRDKETQTKDLLNKFVEQSQSKSGENEAKSEKMRQSDEQEESYQEDQADEDQKDQKDRNSQKDEDQKDEDQKGNRITFTAQYSSPVNDQEHYTEVITGPMPLPRVPTTTNLDSAAHAAAELLSTRLGREFLILYFDFVNYLEILWTVHEQLVSQTPSSNSEALRMLWSASDIVKVYLMLGDVVLIDRITELESFTKILNMLEYDRGFGSRRAEFVQYALTAAKPLDLVRESNPDVYKRLEKPFRLYTLLEIVTRTAFDEYSFNILRTLMYMHYTNFLEELCEVPQVIKSIFDAIKSTKREDLSGTDSETGNVNVNVNVNVNGNNNDDVNGNNNVNDNNDDEMDTSQTENARLIEELKLDSSNQAIRFIAAMVKTSRNVNANQCRVFCHALVENGLLDSFEFSIYHTDLNEVKVLALESILAIVDANIQTVSSFEKPLIRGLVFILLEDVTRSKLNTSAKALQIQAYTLLKALYGESPSYTISYLFERINDLLLNPKPGILIGQLLLSILQLIIFCYSDASEIVAETMEKLGSWSILINANLFNRSDMSPHLQSQLAMYAIRLLRTALVSGCHLLGCEEANNLAQQMIESRFVEQVLTHITNNRLIVNAEEYSASLSLFCSLLDAFKLGEKSAVTMVRYMTTEMPDETRLLAETYPVVEQLYETRLKRQVSDVLDEGGQKQRPKVSSCEFLQTLNRIPDLQ